MSSRNSTLRTWLGRAGLVLLPVFGLLVAEGVARWTEPPSDDPRWRNPYFRVLHGEDGEPLVDAQGRPWWSNEPSMARSVDDPRAGPRAFTAEKAPETRRLVSIGASTTYGLKYAPYASYTEMLDFRVDRVLGTEGGLEIINAGISGYDSHDLPGVAREAIALGADHLLISLGHNELKLPNLARVTASPALSWVRRSALLRRLLPKPPATAPRPETVVETATLTPDQRRHALQLYRDALIETLRHARRHDVGVTLCTPVSNLRDKEPRQTVLSSTGETFQTDATWLRRLFDRHGPHVPAAPERVATADLAAVDAFLDREPGAALGHFLRGRLLWTNGDQAEAARAFRRALETDALPERAWPELVEIVRDVASTFDVGLVDLEQRLRWESPGGVAGFDLFFDYCHPNLRGHWILADAILMQLLDDRSVWSSSQAQAVRSACVNDRLEEFTTERCVDEAMGVLVQARERIGQALASSADDRERLLAVAREFVQSVRPGDVPPATQAEAWFLRAILDALDGEAAACREAWDAARQADATQFAADRSKAMAHPLFRGLLEQMGVSGE